MEETDSLREDTKIPLVRVLNHARMCLHDAENESSYGLTASHRFIDMRVSEAREYVERALLIVSRDN